MHVQLSIIKQIIDNIRQREYKDSKQEFTKNKGGRYGNLCDFEHVDR